MDFYDMIKGDTAEVIARQLGEPLLKAGIESGTIKQVSIALPFGKSVDLTVMKDRKVLIGSAEEQRVEKLTDVVIVIGGRLSSEVIGDAIGSTNFMVVYDQPASGVLFADQRDMMTFAAAIPDDVMVIREQVTIAGVPFNLDEHLEEGVRKNFEIAVEFGEKMQGVVDEQQRTISQQSRLLAHARGRADKIGGYIAYLHDQLFEARRQFVTLDQFHRLIDQEEDQEMRGNGGGEWRWSEAHGDHRWIADEASNQWRRYQDRDREADEALKWIFPDEAE